MSLYHPPLKFPHVVCLSITPHLTFMLDSQSGRSVCTTLHVGRYVPDLTSPLISIIPAAVWWVCVCPLQFLSHHQAVPNKHMMYFGHSCRTYLPVH